MLLSFLSEDLSVDLSVDLSEDLSEDLSVDLLLDFVEFLRSILSYPSVVSINSVDKVR